MTKVMTTVLMLFLTLSGAFCYANDMARTENKKGDGIPIEVKQHTGSVSQPDKSCAIIPTLDGHCLTVSFTENLGQVTIEVSTVSGTSVHFTSTPTPNGVQCYIPNTGYYIVTFTLLNGDEYYGEFTVTE